MGTLFMAKMCEFPGLLSALWRTSGSSSGIGGWQTLGSSGLGRGAGEAACSGGGGSTLHLRWGL